MRNASLRADRLSADRRTHGWRHLGYGEGCASGGCCRSAQRFAQEAGRPVGNLLVADELGVQPFDDRGIAQALGIVGEIVRGYGDDVEAFLELKAEGRVVLVA